MAEGRGEVIDRLPRGAPVEVLSTFEYDYCPGFVVSDATDEGYRVRRISDGEELPVVFPLDDVRAV
ncbi:MAG: hypothetical protein ACRD0G_06900 [Acidimicrobiales bacterium]